MPERGGLSLGGPLLSAPSLPGSKGSPPPVGTGPARPSLREQIASIGSDLGGEGSGPAKRTVNLDSREERYSDYLRRLKQRVYRVWEYPEEAGKAGIGGEVHIVFTLNSAGSLIYMHLVRSSGFPILDEEALRALKLAAPYDPFLAQMGEEPMNIQATFRYDMPRYFRR